MVSLLPPPERTSHPFYTYEMIKSIPHDFASTMEAMNRADLASFASKRPVTFTGCGTAFYATVTGSQILGLGDLSWSATQAYELARYQEPKGVVVGVSHSGITKTTVDALALAKERMVYTVGITHFEDRPISRASNMTIIVGDGPDKSRCHTKAYVTSAAAVLRISLEHTKLLGRRLSEVENGLESLREKLVEVTDKAEEPARELAENVSRSKKIYFVGAGPNQVTAREAALKVKETSFFPAEGIELEDILHGPWASIDEETLVITIAPSGPSIERVQDLIKVCRNIGAKTLVISDSDRKRNFDADYVIGLPSTHEYLSPFLAIIPAYFFAYFLALKKGNNPDYLRYLEPKYWAARQIIFPPGTH
jgi:glucosamine--fructose-6-phosphate aminotransferase (isomerizing)